MKNVLMMTTLILIAFSTGAFAQTQPTPDEKAIFGVMTEVGKAWSAHDVTSFAQFLTKDCVHIDPQGSESKGREAIQKHLQGVIDNEISKNNEKFEVLEYSLRMLKTDAAILNFLARESGKMLRQTVVLQKIESEWKIASFQLTFVSENSKVDNKIDDRTFERISVSGFGLQRDEAKSELT